MTDKERLDFLQWLTDLKRYTGKIILRDSSEHRGWRLHESSREDAVNNVRQAIDNYARELGFIK